MKSLRMATFKGRPWRAESAAKGLSLSCFAASTRPENADLGAEDVDTACVTSFAAPVERREVEP